MPADSNQAQSAKQSTIKILIEAFHTEAVNPYIEGGQNNGNTR
jgi:hypothetical protein